MSCTFADRIAALEKQLDGDDAGTPAKTLPAKGKGLSNAEKAFGAPAIRKGESSQTSRPFSYLKLIGAMAGVIEPEDAKVEAEVATGFKRVFVNDGSYRPEANAVLAPFGTDLFPEVYKGETFLHDVKSLVTGGGVDLDEVAWLRRKLYQHLGKASGQSWLDESLGGSLVAPPQQGELIDLFRNKDALVNAGARVIPLPPQGRIQFPRQTAASQGFWVGENAPIGTTQVKTGTMNLSARKVGCVINTPNELIRYGGPTAEALFRMDMTKTLSLTFDKQALDGQGSDTRPLGLLNVPGIATVTPTTVAAGGNTLAPQDVYGFLSAVMANNAEFEGWIMRPELFFAIASKRVGGSTSTDGPFAFSMFRQLQDKIEAALAGYRATLTPQVANNRPKADGTAAGQPLTYLVGGMWSDFLLAMFGSIEFALSTQGDTVFANDQTAIRAILSCDSGPRHPGAFAVADNLIIG